MLTLHPTDHRPSRGDIQTYTTHTRGVTHADFHTALLAELNDRGWVVAGDRYTTARHKQWLSGAMLLRNIPDLPPPKGHTWTLGLRNATDGRRSPCLFLGTLHAASRCGLVYYEIPLEKQEATGLRGGGVITDLGAAMAQAVDDYLFSARQIHKDIHNLHVRMEYDDMASTVVAAGKRRMMPWSRIGRVVDLWFQPPAEWGEEPMSRWYLLLAFATVVKQNPAPQQMEQLYQFFNLLSN